MSTPSTPEVTAAPVNTEINPESQAAADEAARKAKEKQQKGVSATKTILTHGLSSTSEDEEEKTKRVNSLG